MKFYLSNRIHMNAKEIPVKSSVPYPDDIDDYFRTDLHVEKTITDKFNIWLNIRNVLDRNNYIPAIWGSEGGIPDERLNASLGGRYTF